eukprot:366551-Chlamydomonas_euryale.AAC.3
MRMMKHQNIVTLSEVIDNPNGSKLLLIMEFMDGGPLLTREVRMAGGVGGRGGWGWLGEVRVAGQGVRMGGWSGKGGRAFCETCQCMAVVVWIWMDGC